MKAMLRDGATEIIINIYSNHVLHLLNLNE